MFTYLFIITSVGFFLWIIRNTLFWVELWQSKEYRMDRLSVHLRETVQGKRLLTSPVSIGKWILILGYVLVVYNQSATSLYEILVSLFFVYEGLFVFGEIASGYKLRRPVKTLKALSITGLSLIFITLLFISLGFYSHGIAAVASGDLAMTWRYVLFLILDRILVFIIALFVFLFALPTQMYLDYKIKKAKAVVQDQKKLLVIAISGSYGKSSTKEYIAQVLQEKYNVVKTLDSNNTPIGIANAIFRRITNKTDIFVVEMGAYKKGEIAQLCSIVMPNISVTTSVSDQHLSLYGSIQNAIDTEMELISALPDDGLALFNGNNENTVMLYKETKKKKKILYKVASSNERLVSSLKSIPADITGTNVIQEKEKLTFTVSFNKKIIHFEAPLLGVHMIENILPAIFIANHLEIPIELIKNSVAHLVPPPKTMSRNVLKNGATLVDDTFNASPESVRAAIDYIKVYDKKKILVLMPLVELGEHAKKRHYDIGLQASKVCDYLFVTNKNFYEQLKQGIEDGKGTCQLKTGKIPDLVENIITLAKKDDVIIFEGKEAGKVLQKLE